MTRIVFLDAAEEEMLEAATGFSSTGKYQTVHCKAVPIRSALSHRSTRNYCPRGHALAPQARLLEEQGMNACFI